MARLHRPPYTKPIPPGSEIITHKDKPHARFKDESGRTVLAPLTKKGDRIRLLSKKWYGEFRDADGVRAASHFRRTRPPRGKCSPTWCARPS